LDIRGIAHMEFVPPGRTVNGKVYCESLRRLRENVRRKRPEMWKNGNWLLHHDNAPAHTSLLVRECLKKITWALSPTLPIHLTWPAAISTCFLKWNSGWKWMFRLHWRVPSRIATDTKHANAGRLHWVLPKVAKSLGWLYTIPRWLLRRWRWKLGLEINIHVITSKLSEILCITTYVKFFLKLQGRNLLLSIACFGLCS